MESKYDTTVVITDFNVDWMKIKAGCMTTISKEAGTKEPSDEWKKKLIICRHSPLRRTLVSWKWPHIPYFISTHFARHNVGCEKFIGTERTDRTGVDRSERKQTDYVPMEMDANVQALMNISERRLCMCADPDTRAYWETLVDEIAKYDEIIAWGMVPQCVRCGGCVEPFSKCEYYKNIMKDVSLEDQQDPLKRYDIYNQKVREKKRLKGVR